MLFHCVKTQIYRKGEEIVKQGAPHVVTFFADTSSVSLPPIHMESDRGVPVDCSCASQHENLLNMLEIVPACLCLVRVLEDLFELEQVEVTLRKRVGTVGELDRLRYGEHHFLFAPQVLFVCLGSL